MLNWIHQRKHKIAGGALATFAGGWLLFLCQVCMAQPGVDHAPLTQMQSGSDVPCHDSQNPAPDDTDVVKNHCLGACDCDAVSVSVNTVEPSQTIEKPKLDNLDVVALTISNPQRYPGARSTYPIGWPPEQALLLPLEHYTVLLN